MVTTKVRATTAAQRERWFRDPETILADVQAAMTPQRKRTDPLPYWRIKVWRQGRERVQKEKKRAAGKRSIARVAAGFAAKRVAAGPSVVSRMLAAMDPGLWYGLKALGRAAGVPHPECDRVGQTLRNKRLAERVANPAWDPKAWRDGAGREPKWLYRLTAEGLARKGGAFAPPRDI